jgi:hypothetical protein
MTEAELVIRLDARFAAAYLQLETCSHARTANPQGGNSGGEHGHVILWDTDMPAPDIGAEAFRRRYDNCLTNQARLAVIEATEREVEHLRRQDPSTRPVGETPGQRDQRHLEETAGSSPTDVGRSAHGITAGHIRKLRRQAGLNVETGYPHTNLTAAQVASESVRLWAGGHGLKPTEIGRRLGVHHETVRRHIGAAHRAHAA